MNELSKKSRWFCYGQPFLLLFFYFLIGVVLMLLFGNTSEMILSYACNVLCSFLFGFLAFREYRDLPKISKDDRLRFSVFGWFCLLIVFFALYVSSEALGQYLGFLFPFGSTSAYQNMSDRDILVYVIMGVTVGPVCEELLFRWFMFHRFRYRLSFWWSYFISTLFFVLIHGTIMHIPITVALSLFICVIYEVTGEFRWCVFFHILFNLLGSSFIFSVNYSIYVLLVVWIVVMIILISSYFHRETIFRKYLVSGGLEKMESYLDYKIKHMGDSSDDEDDMNQ